MFGKKLNDVFRMATRGRASASQSLNWQQSVQENPKYKVTENNFIQITYFTCITKLLKKYTVKIFTFYAVI